MTGDKLYTVEEATRTLPLVRKIVEDIVREHRRWRDVVTELELLAASARADGADERTTLLERDAQRLAAELDGFTRELESLEIVLKDRRLGLVDFPAERDGRRIWLCWRLGEPTVQYWHELDAGFAGRRPLEPALAG
jgi:hypothetical protein